MTRTHAHNDWQSRAGSLRRFIGRRKDDINRMQKWRAKLDAEFREARDTFRVTLALVKRSEAQRLHQEIVRAMIMLESLERQHTLYQSAADHQRQAKEFLEAAQ